MNQATTKFNQRLILSALNNIADWEEWTEAVPQGSAKTLNLSLIRLTKGLVKGWRIYLGEQGQQHSTSSRPMPSPWNVNKETVNGQIRRL